MLLAFDVGNSNVKIGLLRGEVWTKIRISSQVQRTADEYFFFIKQFLEQNTCSWSDIEGVIVSSVVPLITGELHICLETNMSLPYLFLTSSVETGLKIATEYPHELGSDLIANAVGAYTLSGHMPCIAVAFGTATTFTAVNSSGELCGVALAPGVETALVSLVKNTALLRQVKLEMPKSSIGRNTQEALRSGLILGNLGAAEYLVRQQIRELREEIPVQVYCTGFFGKFYQEQSECLGRYQEDLLFFGLSEIWRRQS